MATNMATNDRPETETALAAIKWNLDHYGPRDAEPFRYSRFESPAHAALAALTELGWVPPSALADAWQEGYAYRAGRKHPILDPAGVRVGLDNPYIAGPDEGV